MPKVCNIDRKGRVVRLIYGLVLLGGGLFVALGLDRPILGGVLALAGAFGLYEAWRGWCVMRALGFRTPL